MDVCQYCVLMEHWSAWVFKMEHWSAWVFKHSCTSNAGIKKKFKWSVCWQQLNILDCAQALKNPLWVIFWQMIWFYGCHQSVTVNVAVQHSGATHDISQSKMSRYTNSHSWLSVLAVLLRLYVFPLPGFVTTFVNGILALTGFYWICSLHIKLPLFWSTSLGVWSWALTRPHVLMGSDYRNLLLLYRVRAKVPEKTWPLFSLES